MRRLWSEAEITLALDLYMSCDEIPDIHDPRVCELAAFIHRTEGAVVFKLRNIRRFDIGLPGGAPHGSKADKRVWDEYHDKTRELETAASEIRSRRSPR